MKRLLRAEPYDRREAAEATAEAAEAANTNRTDQNGMRPGDCKQIQTSDGGHTDEIFGPAIEKQPQQKARAKADRQTDAAGHDQWKWLKVADGNRRNCARRATDSAVSYTEGDIQRQEREAEQRRVEDERQRAALTKARQEEETHKGDPPPL